MVRLINELLDVTPQRAAELAEFFGIDGGSVCGGGAGGGSSLPECPIEAVIVPPHLEAEARKFVPPGVRLIVEPYADGVHVVYRRRHKTQKTRPREGSGRAARREQSNR
jgi:hypothetical protein